MTILHLFYILYIGYQLNTVANTRFYFMFLKHSTIELLTIYKNWLNHTFLPDHFAPNMVNFYPFPLMYAQNPTARDVSTRLLQHFGMTYLLIWEILTLFLVLKRKWKHFYSVKLIVIWFNMFYHGRLFNIRSLF